MTRRIRNPRYGMMVTDATGTWMLITQRTFPSRGVESLVWYAWRMPTDRMELVFLDPDAFGEVAE